MQIQKVHKRDILELSFVSETEYNNPYLDGGMSVIFYSPEGIKTKVKGFWDGGDVWRVRFAPSISGTWKWESKAASTCDTGLDGKTGEFVVIEHYDNNPILKHGFLQVTDNGRGFAHEDGKPFFWLGDTVWFVPGKATGEDWHEFINYRSKQGFNIACVSALPMFDTSIKKLCEKPFVSDGNIMHWDKINPEYFKYLDQLMHITQQAGMFTALVALWFNFVPGANRNWDTEKMEGLTAELAAAYGSYLVSRYAAYCTLWIISGDSDYETEEVISIYEGAANAIKQDTPYKALITAHLQMGLSTPEIMNERDWLAFHMYQSSHRMNSVQTAIECAERDRALLPARPILNGEPCYENICCHKELDKKITREFVREVLWKSILTGGNAGITYGAHGIWLWHCEGDPFEGADEWGMPVSWREALRFEGSEDAVKMKVFFEGLPWWELEPVSHELKLCEYPDCVAAATPDRSIIVAYVPKGKELKMYVENYDRYTCNWFNPISGERKLTKPGTKGNYNLVAVPPLEGDAVMLLFETK